MVQVYATQMQIVRSLCACWKRFRRAWEKGQESAAEGGTRIGVVSEADLYLLFNRLLHEPLRYP